MIEHDHGGECADPHRDPQPVDDDRPKDEAVHDKGALGRDRGARDQQVTGQHDERDAGGDFLDRVAQRDRRDQRQSAAHGEKHKGADEPQMQPGNRQQVRQTGIAEGLLDLFLYRAAFAGDQRRSDTAGRARKNGRDPPRHLGAQLPQILAPAAFASPARRSDGRRQRYTRPRRSRRNTARAGNRARPARSAPAPDAASP